MPDPPIPTSEPQAPPQKPHKWNKREDAPNCVECGRAFKRGDDVFTDIAVNLHVACLGEYQRSLDELGLVSKELGGVPCNKRQCRFCKGHGICIAGYEKPVVTSDGKEVIGEIVPCKECKSQGYRYTAKKGVRT